MKYLSLLFFIPSFLFSQDESQGIRFENTANWQQLREKAHQEKKIIFLDCYATWCGPCKKMDTEVFSQKELKDVFQNILATRVQMDSTLTDSRTVKQWYSDALELRNKYEVKGFPTFLFFDSNGRLIYRAFGYKSVSDFKSIALALTNPKNQYYELLESYKKGSRIPEDMIFLARNSRNLGNETLASQIAKDYIELNGPSVILDKSHISFMREFATQTKSNGFDFIYKNAEKINDEMEDPDFAQGFISSIIAKEEIDSVIRSSYLNGTVPNFDNIYLKIKNKFGNYYADRVVSDAKVNWFASKNDYVNSVKNLVHFVEVFAINIKSAWLLNNYAWYIFQHSNEPDYLALALATSKRATLLSPSSTNWKDTYANILYKLGRKDEAMMLESELVKMEPKNKDFLLNLDKMKKGIPTW